MSENNSGGLNDPSRSNTGSVGASGVNSGSNGSGSSQNFGSQFGGPPQSQNSIGQSRPFGTTGMSVRPSDQTLQDRQYGTPATGMPSSNVGGRPGSSNNAGSVGNYSIVGGPKPFAPITPIPFEWYGPRFWENPLPGGPSPQDPRFGPGAPGTNSVPDDEDPFNSHNYDPFGEDRNWQDVSTRGLSMGIGSSGSSSSRGNPPGAAGDNSGQGGLGAVRQQPPQRPGGIPVPAPATGGIGPNHPMAPGFAERQAAARLNGMEKKAALPARPAPRPAAPPPRPAAPAFGGAGGRSPAATAGGGQIRRFARGGRLRGYADGGEMDDVYGIGGDRTGNPQDMELLEAPGGASITPVPRDIALALADALFGGKKGGYGGARQRPARPNRNGNDRGDRASFRASDDSMRINDSNNRDGGGGMGPPGNDGTGQPRGFGNPIPPGNTEAPPPGNPRGFFGGVHRVNQPQTAGFAFSRPRPMGNPNGAGFRVPGINTTGNYTYAASSGNFGEGGHGPDDDNASSLGVSGGPGPWG